MCKSRKVLTLCYFYFQERRSNRTLEKRLEDLAATYKDLAMFTNHISLFDDDNVTGLCLFGWKSFQFFPHIYLL